MSRGRRAVSLEGLRAAADEGHYQAVVQALTGNAPVAPPSRVTWSPQTPEPQGLDRRLGHLDGWPWEGKPVDWPYRTTARDVLEEAAEMATERLSWSLALLVDHVAFGTGGRDVQITSQERAQVQAMLTKCRIQVMRELAKTPRRHQKVKRPPTRWEGPCSAVTTRVTEPIGRTVVEVEDRGWDFTR